MKPSNDILKRKVEKQRQENISLFQLPVGLISIELQEFNYAFKAWKSRRWFGKTEFLRLREQSAFSLRGQNDAQSEYNSKLTNLICGLIAYHFSATLIAHRATRLVKRAVIGGNLNFLKKDIDTPKIEGLILEINCQHSIYIITSRKERENGNCNWLIQFPLFIY